MLNKLNDKKGFTLIEIVVVLAIAALILTVVFMAVQGAQRSRRDAQRKEAAARIGSYLEQSASNKEGQYPNTGGISQTPAQFNTNYANRVMTPNGAGYTATWAGAYGTCPAALGIDVVQVSYAGRQWQVAIGLETGDAFCTRS